MKLSKIKSWAVFETNPSQSIRKCLNQIIKKNVMQTGRANGVLIEQNES